VQMLLMFLALTVILIPVIYALSLFLSLLVVSVYSAVFFGCGVNPFAGKNAIKKLTTFAGTFVFEMLPLIGEIAPSLTFWTWLTIRQSRHEDREKAERDAKILEEKRQRYFALMQRREAEAHMIAYQQNVAHNNTTVREVNENNPTLRRPLPIKSTRFYPRKVA